MPNPELIDLPADEWTKVATAVTIGNLHKKKPTQVVFISTHRKSGETAPDPIKDKEEGVQIFVEHPTREGIKNSFAIDIYVMPVGVGSQLRADL